MGRWHLTVLLCVLFGTGLGTFVYKVRHLDFPVKPNVESPIWNIEARVSFRGRNKPTKVELIIPATNPGALIMDESFVSSGFGLTTKTEDSRRKAVWSIRRAQGTQNLYYRAVVFTVDSKKVQRTVRTPPELIDPAFEGAQLTAANQLIAEITPRSADTEGFVLELLNRLNQQKNRDEILKALLPGISSDEAKAQLAVRILALAKITARTVHGIRLVDHGGNVPLLHWIEVYQREDKRWQQFELRGAVGVPESYFAWWRGNDKLAFMPGKEKVDVSISVTRSLEAALLPALRGERTESPLLFELSLFSLPLDAQVVYRVLFMLPIGAFIIVLLRQVIGITTFGTFMPVLIALAFRETRLAWGVLLLLLLVSSGLMMRFYLERLKLLLVPRLTAGLIVVVLLMAGLSLLTHKLGVEGGLSVALFPMVVVAMTIERMSIVWEELGPADAIKQGIGSLLAASLCYLVMSNEQLQHLFFVFPELLLVLLGMTIILGRYTGYRLVELKRFRDLIAAADDAR